MGFSRAPFFILFLTVCIAGLVSCSSSSGGGLTPVPPQATPTPAPGLPGVSPASLTFLGTGGALAQPVTVSESNYSGNFSVAGCSGIATTNTASSSGAFSITPLGAGSCTLTFTDAQQRTTTLAVSVTVTLGGGE